MQTTMREANDRGYECLLIEDATESYFPEFKAATIEMITAQGGDRRLGDAARGAEARRRREDAPDDASDFDPEAMIDALAPLLGLAVDARIPRRRERATCAAARTIAAAIVLAFELLDDRDEPAPVYRP